MNAGLQLTGAEQALGMALPGRRDEEWKWTDLHRLVDRAYAPATTAPKAADVDRLLAASPLASLHGRRLVLVNGKLDEARSRLQGLEVKTTAPEILRKDPVLSLNARLSAKAIALHFSGNEDLPVEVVHVSSGSNAALASRLHVSVADGASATVIETFVGDGEYLNVPVSTLSIGKGARLDRVKIECESSGAQHLSHLVVDMGESAQFNDFMLTTGALLVRQNGDAAFNGPHANARMSGSYLLKGRQHADTRLVVDHRVPHCTSRELFKCVMADNARGIFQGKVIVQPDAQKTDGKQSSHALLLSESAEFDAKPELEIYADDVVCGHGATCGDLNLDHLFYLRSRGIPEAQARAMLVNAFVAEAVETVESEAIREALLAFIPTRLE